MGQKKSEILLPSVIKFNKEVKGLYLVIMGTGIAYSVISIATRLRFGRSGVRTTAGVKGFVSFPKRPDGPWGSPNLPSSGHRGSFAG